MKLKRKFNSLACIVLCGSLLLCGCSSIGNADSESSQTTQYADQNFIKSLSTGLESRWKLGDKFDAEHAKNNTADVIDVDERTTLINTELSAINQYKNAEFQDSKLQEKALSYINALNDSLQALNYISSDPEKYITLWEGAYDNRSTLIKDFVENYGLTVDNKYQSTLNELISNAQAVSEKEKQKKLIDKLVSSMKFELAEDDYGYRTYTATVQNNTGINFSTFDININLLDNDGTIVETNYDSISQFNNGSTAKFKFSTDVNFSSTQVSTNYYEISN